MQLGSEGCKVAQVRDVRSGCAGLVIGLMELRDAGRDCEFGKRIGETNGLDMLVVRR